MPAIAPHPRLLHSPCRQRLHRRAHAFTLGGNRERGGGVTTIHQRWIEDARARLQRIDRSADLLEHDSPSGTDTDSGKRRKYSDPTEGV